MKLLLATIYLTVVLAPLALSWFVGGPPRSFQSELASGVGMLAFSMILVEFVLSGRSKFLSRHVGMDVIMRFHQLMARTALIFALAHPFLYSGSPVGGLRPWDTTRQLTLTTDAWPLLSGIAAFVVLPTFVLLSFARVQMDYRYEIWRFLHGFGALAIAALLLHHTKSAGRYAAEPELAWLWTGMTVIAVAALLQSYVIEPLLQFRKGWVVTSVTQLAPRQWNVVLAPRDKRLNYMAGQFAWLNIGRSPFSVFENPFSISSAPAQGPDVEFIIKELGDFTGQIGQIKPGTRAFLDAPYGSLCVDRRPEPGVVLIAGGVGVAPLLGILRQMHLTDDPRKSMLIYGNRMYEQIVYRAELDRYAATTQTDVTYVLSEPHTGWTGEVGMIDEALLDRSLSSNQLDNWLFVLCGPPKMMDVVEDHLIGRGVSASRILSERFAYD